MSHAFTILSISLLVCVVVGCNDAKPPEVHVPANDGQKITGLTDADLKRLQDQRAIVEKYIPDGELKSKYKSAAGKLGAIRTILKSGEFKPDQTYKLQCLGIVLGDVFVQKLDMEWIMVEDQHGRDPAIRMPGTSIVLFPLTMISKRVERGEDVDVFELFNKAAAKIEEVKKKGA